MPDLTAEQLRHLADALDGLATTSEATGFRTTSAYGAINLETDGGDWVSVRGGYGGNPYTVEVSS